MSESSKDRIVVIGAGTGGIATTARLLRVDPKLQITILDKSDKHYYQPGWTFVGCGVWDFDCTERRTRHLIPSGAKWVREHAKEVRPKENVVITEEGTKVPYDYLVIAAGISTEWDKIPGLKESLGKYGVCSNYSGGVNTWEVVRNFTSGTAIFTTRAPLKCGGAPMKAMFLSWDYWREKGLSLANIKIQYATPNTAMFPVKKYNTVIEKLCVDRKIERLWQHSLVRVDGPRRTAWFRTPEGDKPYPFNMLHVAPPMAPPQFLRGTSLSNKDGFVEVDDFTLQHKRYPNVFALGDCTALPTSKTAAAICRQSPVVVHNLLQHRQGKKLNARYDGYTSCPLVTGFGSLLLMEFGYGNKIMEHLPWDQGVHDGKIGRANYFIKKYIFPPSYWNGILKGRWYGPSGPFPPSSMVLE